MAGTVLVSCAVLIRAARELALSQPSVSNQVAQLERELGARLLERRPGGLRLTREGEILLEHADAIAERFQLAGAQLAAAAAGQRARLRIGALPTALAGFVPAAIARLRRQHPGTSVTFDEGTPEELAARLASGELDLAIVYEDARLAHRGSAGLGRHQVIVRACRAAGFEPNLISITRDQLAIRALIMRGLAVTLVPELLADPFKDLALRPIADMTVARDVYALIPPGGRHPLLAPTLDALDAVAAQLPVERTRERQRRSRSGSSARR